MATPGTAAPNCCPGLDGAADQVRAEKRPRRIVDENQIGRVFRQSLHAGPHRDLSRSTAGDWIAELAEATARAAEQVLIRQMDDRLDHIDMPVARKRGKRRADDGCAGNGPILLGDVAADALAPASRNDHCRNDPHRKCPLPFRGPL